MKSEKLIRARSVQNWILKLVFFSGIEVDGAVGGSEAVDAIAEALRTYQNQTAEDIESGRARMDSVRKKSVKSQHDKLKTVYQNLQLIPVFYDHFWSFFAN